MSDTESADSRDLQAAVAADTAVDTAVADNSAGTAVCTAADTAAQQVPGVQVDRTVQKGQHTVLQEYKRHLAHSLQLFRQALLRLQEPPAYQREPEERGNVRQAFVRAFPGSSSEALMRGLSHRSFRRMKKEDR